MKNKKLFAILTLVCFMFTLMPVAAFAASTDLDNENSLIYLTNTTDTKKLSTGDTSVTFDNLKLKIKNVGGTTVPVGSTADQTINERLYVWAEKNGSVSPAMNAPVAERADGETTTAIGADLRNVYVFNSSVAAESPLTVEFVQEGTYTVYAAFGPASADEWKDLKVLTTNVELKVNGVKANPDSYDMDVTCATATVTEKTDENGYETDWRVAGVVPNNVTNQLVLTFTENNKELIGKTVSAKSDSANLMVNPADGKTTTDALGVVKLNISAAREGNYTIYVTIDGRTFTIEVQCTNTAAAYIETYEQPENKVALYTNDTENDLISFKFTDINGNAVRNLSDNLTSDNDQLRGQYLHFIQKPADTTLTNADLEIVTTGTHNDGVYALSIGDILDAEGVYTVRAILNNGAVATATFEVKAFETPVELVIDAPTTVELGEDIEVGLTYLDANGVEKDAIDAKLAATGYAIASFEGSSYEDYTVTLKTDEKYAGSTVTLTAVSEMYDLVATQVVKVAAEAVAIEFEDNSLEVNVNNKVDWNVVDAEGNAVTLQETEADIRYVVLDKPADAKVSVYDLTDDTTFDGDGTMALTSNMVGNVTVQVIAQVAIGNTNAADNGAAQYKYYTGTQIFAVGTASVGDVVVMSIGSNEIVINDAKATIDAAPIVENNRTFVPFRALAEAFGATVAYDEATQAVTAELNGVTVVMTIGSAEYTVNGEAKTADVAPFINGSRTMVPVRFAAEAFGIKVIPTYDENGATADILFNL